MRPNATILTDTTGRGVEVAAELAELSGVGSQQVAGSGRVATHLYAAVLDRDLALPGGQPVFVRRDGAQWVGWPVLQSGRTLRLARRDGEFYPGLALERLGRFEPGLPAFYAQGTGFTVLDAGTNTYVTADFEGYEPVPALRGLTLTAAVNAGRVLHVATADRIASTPDGRAWTLTPMPAGAGSVHALAFDGQALWVGTASGLYRMDAEARTFALVQPGLWEAFTQAPDNAAPLVARRTGAGMHELYAPGGTLQRLLAVGAPLGFNLARYRNDENGPRCLAVDLDGSVVDFGLAALRTVGRIEAGGRARLAPSAAALCGIGLVCGFGRLAWTDGEALTPVYDFGDAVQPGAGPLGPLYARPDGLVYRVRRCAAP